MYVIIKRNQSSQNKIANLPDKIKAETATPVSIKWNKNDISELMSCPRPWKLEVLNEPHALDFARVKFAPFSSKSENPNPKTHFIHTFWSQICLLRSPKPITKF